MKDGSRALRYESIALAAFDLYILKRFGAKKDYSKEQQIKAKIYLDALLEEEKTKLIKNIIAGFPGTKEGYTLEQFKIILNTYNEIDANKLKEHLILFLREIFSLFYSLFFSAFLLHIISAT